MDNWKNSLISAIFKNLQPNTRTENASWNPIKYCKDKIINFGFGKYVGYLDKLQNKLKNISALTYILILGVLAICLVIMFGMLWNMLFSSCLICYSICKYIIGICFNCYDKFLMMIIIVIIYKLKFTTVKVSKSIIILNIQVNYMSHSTKDTTNIISNDDMTEMVSNSDEVLKEDFELISS